MTDPVLFSTAAGRGLRWQPWDGVYLVYQPSSAETHVFNETTALILRALEHDSQAIDALQAEVARELGVDPGDLEADDFAFAVARLQELGLIDSLAEDLAHP